VDRVRPVVRDGRGHEQHVGAFELHVARRGELARGLDVHAAHAGRRVQRDVGGHERDLGAAPRGLGGERHAHAPGRAVADEAHGVDRLARPARGHEHPQAGEVAAAGERRLDRGQQLRRLRQPADSPLADRGERARARLEHPRAPRAQAREVLLRRRVLVHGRVHRRGDHQRPPAGERGGGEQVVG
jgi:hypothetical protein